MQEFLIFYVASALLSLLLGRRSQVDAWAERHPRIAAVLKLMRSLGLDPWMAIQALSLAVTKKLPAPPRDKPKDDDKTPPGGTPTRIHFMAAPCLAFLLTGCFGGKPPSVAGHAHDAYRAALSACELYAMVPAEHRTKEADMACHELVDVCTDPTPEPADAGAEASP